MAIGLISAFTYQSTSAITPQATSSQIVDGNGALAVLADSGDGSIGNPYIIENISFNAGGGSTGIDIRNTDKYLTIRNCTFFNTAKGNSAWDTGCIRLFKVNHITVNNCTVSSSRKGIAVWYSRNVCIHNNTVRDNERGIHISSCDGCLVENNTVSHGLIGIWLASSPKNNITHNFVSDCFKQPAENLVPYDVGGFGISLCCDSDQNMVHNNTITSCAQYAFSIYQCKGNLITSNNYTGNPGICAYFGDVNSNTMDFLVTSRVSYTTYAIWAIGALIAIYIMSFILYFLYKRDKANKKAKLKRNLCTECFGFGKVKKPSALLKRLIEYDSCKKCNGTGLQDAQGGKVRKLPRIVFPYFYKDHRTVMENPNDALRYLAQENKKPGRENNIIDANEKANNFFKLFFDTEGSVSKLMPEQKLFRNWRKPAPGEEKRFTRFEWEAPIHELTARHFGVPLARDIILRIIISSIFTLILYSAVFSDIAFTPNAPASWEFMRLLHPGMNWNPDINETWFQYQTSKLGIELLAISAASGFGAWLLYYIFYYKNFVTYYRAFILLIVVVFGFFWPLIFFTWVMTNLPTVVDYPTLIAAFTSTPNSSQVGLMVLLNMITTLYLPVFICLFITIHSVHRVSQNGLMYMYGAWIRLELTIHEKEGHSRDFKDVYRHDVPKFFTKMLGVLDSLLFKTLSVRIQNLKALAERFTQMYLLDYYLTKKLIESNFDAVFFDILNYSESEKPQMEPSLLVIVLDRINNILNKIFQDYKAEYEGSVRKHLLGLETIIKEKINALNFASKIDDDLYVKEIAANLYDACSLGECGPVDDKISDARDLLLDLKEYIGHYKVLDDDFLEDKVESKVREKIKQIVKEMNKEKLEEKIDAKVDAEKAYNQSLARSAQKIAELMEYEHEREEEGGLEIHIEFESPLTRVRRLSAEIYGSLAAIGGLLATFIPLLIGSG